VKHRNTSSNTFFFYYTPSKQEKSPEV